MEEVMEKVKSMLCEMHLQALVVGNVDNCWAPSQIKPRVLSGAGQEMLHGHRLSSGLKVNPTTKGRHQGEKRIRGRRWMAFRLRPKLKKNSFVPYGGQGERNIAPYESSTLTMSIRLHLPVPFTNTSLTFVHIVWSSKDGFSIAGTNLVLRVFRQPHSKMMDRVKRFTGMAKGASAVPVRRDEDESLVLFGELYKHEKERDVNLLEPMFSVEFEAVQGDGRMFKLPSGKRDYLLPDGEKHDYDWLKTPPATPLFPSLEMEANSSQMIFQKELPILQPVRTSRFSSKPDATSASTSSGSPTSSSTKSVTPTARPSSSSSKKKPNKGAAAPSKEQDSAYRIDKRSSYTPLTNRQHNSIPAAPTTTTATTATKASKKTSGSKSQPSKAVKNDARPDKASKNITATTTKPRSNDSSVGAKDKKVNAGTTRRLSDPSSAKLDNVQATAALKGRSRATTGSVPATRKDAGATDAVLKGRRRAGEKEQRPKLGSLAKK